MDKKQLCHIYYTMNLIRDFENQALKFFEENVLRKLGSSLCRRGSRSGYSLRTA